jgi:hypothetical protein
VPVSKYEVSKIPHFVMVFYKSVENLLIAESLQPKATITLAL